MENSGSSVVLEAAPIPVTGIARHRLSRHRKSPPTIDNLDVFSTMMGRHVTYKFMYQDR
jgi:hypothetical protein